MNAGKRLRQAMLDLLALYPFERITTDMLVEKADVSRSTFYRHYADKYDLVSESYASVADDILDRADGSNWRELLVEVLTFFSDNREVYQKLIEVNGYNSFSKFLTRYTDKFYRKRFLIGSGKESLDELDEVRLDYLCQGQVGILFSWLQRDCTKPADIRTFADVMYELIPKEIREYM